jgi:hypothetical protein
MSGEFGGDFPMRVEEIVNPWDDLRHELHFGNTRPDVRMTSAGILRFITEHNRNAGQIIANSNGFLITTTRFSERELSNVDFALNRAASWLELFLNHNNNIFNQENSLPVANFELDGEAMTAEQSIIEEILNIDSNLQERPLETYIPGYLLPLTFKSKLLPIIFAPNREIVLSQEYKPQLAMSARIAGETYESRLPLKTLINLGDRAIKTSEGFAEHSQYPLAFKTAMLAVLGDRFHKPIQGI